MSEVSGSGFVRAGVVAVGVLVLVAVAGFVAAAIGGSVRLVDDGQIAGVVRKLQLMAVIALLIERAVEVYLVVTRQNGPAAYAAGAASAGSRPADRVALSAGMTLAFVFALCGLRVVGPAVVVEPGLARWLVDAADVVISAGLMAGGAAVIHEVIEWIRELIGLGRLNNAANIEEARQRLAFAEERGAARRAGGQGQ